MFQEQPDRSKRTTPKIDLAAALRRDAQQLSDDAQTLREREIERIFDLLIEEPERWDGLS